MIDALCHAFSATEIHWLVGILSVAGISLVMLFGSLTMASVGIASGTYAFLTLLISYVRNK